MAKTAARQPPITLLDSKLEVPQRRPQLVRRSRLYEQLNLEPGQLGVVSAAAGSGKSTLLAQWASEFHEQGVAWLSLDEADNDPTRFVAHLVAALRGLSPGVGEQTLAAVGTTGVDLVDDVLPLLLNDLRRYSTLGTLILDDYHTITNDAIHEALNVLLDHRRGSLGFIIASRTDPPLRQSIRRIRGQLRTVSTDDLRMTEPEAEQFFQALGLDLPGDGLARLLRSTEGWVGGLYLAALQLLGSDDPLASVAVLEQSHRHVSDFFASEVLSCLAPDAREFMINTSILERLNGDLAGAVSGRSDAGRLLEELVRLNLFVTPLDATGEWYRYHHLLAKLLRRELDATASTSIPALHGAAARWYADQGHADEAVHHALAAKDVVLAGDIVARNWIRSALERQGDTVLRWFEEIGDESLRADNRLAMARAMTMTHLGRLDEARTWVSIAESAPSAAPPLDGTASSESGAALVRAVCAHFQGDFSLASTHANTAMSLEPSTSPWRSVAALALGGSRYWLGDHAGADEALAESVRVGTRSRMHPPVILAMGYQAAIAFDRGRRVDAGQIAVEALELAERAGAAMYGEPLMAHLVLARILRHDGDVNGGVRHADQAISLGRRAGWPSLLAAALLVRATLGLRRDRRQTAASLIADAEQLLSAGGDFGLLGALVTTVKRQVGTARDTTGLGHGIIEPLTARELDVLRLLQTALTRSEIARELSVSTNTVKTHTQAIYRKLGMSERKRVVERARILGIM